MRVRKSAAAKLVTTFGAGLASAYLAPSAEAAIIPLTPTPGTVNYGAFYGNGATVTLLAGVSFWQFNDTLGNTLFASFLGRGGGLVGFRPTSASNVITAGTSGQWGGGIGGGAGTSTWAFLTTSGNLGWFRLSRVNSGPVTYLAAAYNTVAGSPVHAGSLRDVEVPVPEPTSLALLGLASLALGSRGVRRLREQNRAQ